MKKRRKIKKKNTKTLKIALDYTKRNKKYSLPEKHI